MLGTRWQFEDNARCTVVLLVRACMFMSRLLCQYGSLLRAIGRFVQSELRTHAWIAPHSIGASV